MTILRELIDTLTIQLLGQCRSETILSYLHVQYALLINDTTSRMLLSGNYHLLPDQYVPDIAPDLEQEVSEIGLHRLRSLNWRVLDLSKEPLPQTPILM